MRDRTRSRGAWALGLVLILFVALPNVRAVRQDRSMYRRCYANQKTIVGAIEMYNLDKNTRRTALDDAFFEALRSGGYLQNIPNDPPFGPGSSGHDRTRGDGVGVECTVHGAIQ